MSNPFHARLYDGMYHLGRQLANFIFKMPLYSGYALIYFSIGLSRIRQALKKKNHPYTYWFPQPVILGFPLADVWGGNVISLLGYCKSIVKDSKQTQS